MANNVFTLRREEGRLVLRPISEDAQTMSAPQQQAIAELVKVVPQYADVELANAEPEQ